MRTCLSLLRITALLTVTSVVLAACGETPQPDPTNDADAKTAGVKPGTCRVQDVDLRSVPRPLAGVYWGQEVWISYKSKAHEGQGFRYPRSRDEALAKARGLCRQAHAGADMGQLARRWSNGDFGIADGLCVVPEPSHRAAPDARDVTLFRTPVGKLTPLIAWRGGFWFAKRVSEAQGRLLDAKLRKAMKVRARARVIHIHHRDAFPRRQAFDEYSKIDAVNKAWAIIRELEHAKGQSFAKLAREHGNDEKTRARDGLMMTKDPRTKEPTEWIRWGDRNFNQPLLEVLLETGTPGQVWPEPVVSGQGVQVVLLLERRSD